MTGWTMTAYLTIGDEDSQEVTLLVSVDPDLERCDVIVEIPAVHGDLPRRLAIDPSDAYKVFSEASCRAQMLLSEDDVEART
jgi:hypothetical protein